MNNHANHRHVRRPRPWRIALGMGAGAIAAAAMLGLSEAADAHADSGSDVLGQAGADLTQATSVLDGAPEASLDAQQLALLTGQEMIQTGPASSLLSDQESFFSSLPTADQADLTGADDQLAQAFQGVLNADQAFVAADQAGDLSGTGLLPADLGVLDADFSILPADFNVVVADIGAEFANAFDVSALLP
ncbi:MAG TPA: hypothetical protein VE908_16485 [Mycobacterium sp.]|nr:hypothetical protein [Mycobacterium sp.]